ncbi:PASTA domain-containing protein [Enterococcus faecium]|uniref:PASTA domain-containing protein n=1 Tax=Enterococcus faecium TaxID=1352 RepID=UPI00035463CE|nr:PASTA domain-containing protein [Enterococcus faecium]EPI26564.1 PASTA domain protein [Enterococcus faecium LA4B-2]
MNNTNPYWREESRIYNLEYEIAKTDDPEKRQRLEALLEKERQALYQKMNYNRSRRELEQDNDDSGSFGWWLLGLLLPVVGLILWIVWRRKKPNNAHASIWGAITSVVTGIALVIIAFFVGLRITDMSFDAIKNNSAAPTTIVSSQSEPKSEEIDTKKLSQDQVKKWVYYHMKKDDPNIAGASAYDFSITPNQDSELDIAVSSGGNPVNDYLIDSNGNLYHISKWQKTLVADKWDVPNDFTLDVPTQTDTKQSSIPHDYNLDKTGNSSSPENQTETSMNTVHEQASQIRKIMVQNQNLDPNILNNIPDEEILAANAGNATNAQIAETAQNLINKYPGIDGKHTLENITNYTKNEAQSYLANIEAEYIGNQSYEYSSEVEKDKVIRTDPVAGTKIKKGDIVKVIYSKGADPNTSN